MKIGIQGKNGKLTLTADNLKFACQELGIPDDKHTLRRAARAFDLYYSGKVEHINDHTFRVASQYDRGRPYQVTLHEGVVKPYCYCTCADWMNYSGDMDVPNVDFWCKHAIAARIWLHRQEAKLRYENGSKRAAEIEAKLNGDNGNGDNQSPSQVELDLSDPFQEAEALDIDQIEGRKNGELAWKLSNGEYCISYKGIMTLAQKHNITFTDGDNSLTSQVIARARLNGNERVSGKLPIPSRATACELAKRNAARQLLPLGEIKAIEKKARLEAEFDWQDAKAKCVELVGTDANVDIIIYELVKDGKLRQDNPSHYDRTEWLIIHKACQEDAQLSNDDNNDGGDKTPSSNNDEVNRYKVLADAPVNDNWRERYQECVKLVGMNDTDLIIRQELNFRYSYYKNKITDAQWDVVLQECRYRWNAKQAKAEFASLQNEYKLNHIRWKTGYDVKSKKYVGRPPLNSKEFIAKCQEAIEKVRAENNTVEANEQPLEADNGKRKLQMDKKLRTWLIESDGTKTEISCREICEQFESKQNPSIVTRLRAGIDDGADISTVELND